MSRMLYHKGVAYPENQSDLELLINDWGGCVEEGALDFEPTIAVLPYGAYECSGVTSFVTLSSVDFSRFTRVVFVAPSHQFAFEGVSILAEETVEMLSGNTRAVDIEYTFDLKKRYELSSVSGAHRALSSEAHFPLVEHFTDLPLVEIIYGVNSEKFLSGLLDELAKDDETFLILSCNLSKHHCEKEAHRIDRHIINGIMSLSADEIYRGESKSIPALKALLLSLDRSAYASEVLDYRTSADVEDGTFGTVEGYLGALLGPVKRT